MVVVWVVVAGAPLPLSPHVILLQALSSPVLLLCARAQCRGEVEDVCVDGALELAQGRDEGYGLFGILRCHGPGQCVARRIITPRYRRLSTRHDIACALGGVERWHGRRELTGELAGGIVARVRGYDDSRRMGMVAYNGLIDEDAILHCVWYGM